MKIIHTADWQIDVRANNGRFHEFRDTIGAFVEECRREQPDRVVITGDVFQYSDVNAREQSIFIDALRGLLSVNDSLKVIITNGNHDLKASNNTIEIGGVVTADVDFISVCVQALGSERVLYYEWTGFYEDSEMNIVWAVWSFKNKYHRYSERAYSPWDGVDDPLGMFEGKKVINLFHDQVAGTKTIFGGEQYNEHRVRISMADFPPMSLVLAGHIHIPQAIHGEDLRRLYYCSSLVMRDFSEGDYRKYDGELHASGNDKHGYNIITQGKKGLNVNFVPMKPLVGRHNIWLHPSNIEFFEPVIDVHEHDLVQISFFGSVHLYKQYEDMVCRKLTEAYPSVRHIRFVQNGAVLKDADGVDGESEELVDAADLDIRELAEKWYTLQNGPGEEMGEEEMVLKDLFMEMICTQFEKARSSMSKYEFHIRRFRASNFMAFGDYVDVDMSDLQGLVRVVGTNGAGKTTMGKAIRYCLTGMSDSRQSASKSKQNLLDSINDKNLLDVMYVWLDVEINGVTYLIQRNVELTWKRDFQPEGWRNYVKDIRETLEVSSGGEVVGDPEQFLSEVFGGIDTLERAMFIDKRSIDALMSMSAEKLNDEIIANMGYGFFRDMLDGAKKLRDEAMSGMTKHPDKLKDVLIRRNNLTAELDDISSQLSQATIDRDSLSSEKWSLTEELMATRTRLRPMTPQSDRKRVERALSDKRDELASKRDEYEKKSSLDVTAEKGRIGLEIDRLKVEMDASELPARESGLAEIQGRRKSVTDKRAALVKKRDNVINLLEQAKASQRRRENERFISDRNGYTLALNEATDTVRNAYQGELSKREKEYMALREEHIAIAHGREKIVSKGRELKALLESAQSRLDDLVHTDRCPHCNLPIDGRSKDDMEREFAERSEKVASLQKSIEESREEYKALSQVFNEKEKVLKDAQSAVENFRNRGEDAYADEFYPEIQASRMMLRERLAEKYAEGPWCEEVTTLMTEVVSLDGELKEVLSAEDALMTEIDVETQNIHALRVKQQGIIGQIGSLTAEFTKLSGHEGMLGLLKDHISSAESAVRSLEMDLERMESADVMADEANRRTNEEIAAIQERITGVDERYAYAENRHRSITVQRSRKEQEIVAADTMLAQIKAYETAEAVHKMYRLAVGPKGIPALLFRTVAGAMNKEMNALLSDMNFRLYFDTEGDVPQLRMIDLFGTKSERSVRQGSGMETGNMGVVLSAMLKRWNKALYTPILFADEISDCLSSGDVSTKGSVDTMKDYQALMCKLLRRLCDVDGLNILIIDHVLKDMGQDKTLSVWKSELGSYMEVE